MFFEGGGASDCICQTPKRGFDCADADTAVTTSVARARQPIFNFRLHIDSTPISGVWADTVSMWISSAPCKVLSALLPMGASYLQGERHKYQAIHVRKREHIVLEVPAR